MTINTAVLYNKQTSSYDSKAETMRQSILKTKDTLKASGSDKNYADESLWAKTSTADVWKATVTQMTGPTAKDIGNVIIDYGKICASDGKKMSLGKLAADYDFYYDAKSNALYLYLAADNPGKVYSDIEICIKKSMMQTKGDYKAENITIRGCEIGWIGGSLLHASARYGNGIEFNGSIDGALVEDNWIYQCYDAGYTNQGSNSFQKNITVKDNLIEYNPYNIELWTEKEIGKGGMENCTFKDNILRFAGYGFGSNARYGSNTGAIGNISFYDYVIPCQNVVISGNVFDCSYRYVISIVYPNDRQGRGPTITGNTWNQKPFENSDSTASVGRTKFTDETVIHSCGTQTEMETSVKIFDKDPKAITLEN